MTDDIEEQLEVVLAEILEEMRDPVHRCMMRWQTAACPVSPQPKLHEQCRFIGDVRFTPKSRHWE